jgi:hypothetical protein
MKMNIGTIDKIVRLIVVALIATLYVTHQITGVATIILGPFAVVFLLTSIVSFCPFYLPFGISTSRK